MRTRVSITFIVHLSAVPGSISDISIRAHYSTSSTDRVSLSPFILYHDVSITTLDSDSNMLSQSDIEFTPGQLTCYGIQRAGYSLYEAQCTLMKSTMSIEHHSSEFHIVGCGHFSVQVILDRLPHVTHDLSAMLTCSLLPRAVGHLHA